MLYTFNQVLQSVSARQYERALLLFLPLLPLPHLPQLEKRARLAQACFQLGLFCEQSATRANAPTESEALYRQAVALAPDFLPAWLALTALLAQQSRSADAATALAQVEALAPDSLEFWLLKGNLAQLSLQLDLAQAAYQRVLEHDPIHAGAWNNLGLLHCLSGHWQDALPCFQKAVDLQPHFAEALCNLGLVLLNLGQAASAYDALQASLRLQPERAETLATLGIWAQSQQERSLAEGYLLAALDKDPNQSAAAIQLTWLYYRMQRWSEAFALLPPLLENPRILPATRADLAYTQARLHDFLQQRPEAERFYQTSFALRQPTLLRQLQAALPGPSDRLFDSQDALLAWQADFYKVTQQFEPGSLCLEDYFQELMQQPLETGWGLLYQGEWPLALKADYTRLFSAPAYELPVRRSGTRLRLGYLVSWEHEGIFLKFSQGLISRLNPEQFEVFVICGATAIPRMQQAFKDQSIQYLPLSPFLPGNLERIRSLDLDVLEYWEVGSDNTNFALAYYRLARLQLTSLGTPVSPCIPGLDLYLTSRHLEPLQPQQHYLEPLASLERLPTWFPDLSLDRSLHTRTELGLSEQKHLYLCAQNLLKFHPDFDLLLAGILDQDSAAQIVIFKSKDSHLNALWMQRFDTRFPGYLSRLTWIETLPYAEFLNLLAVADVVLDTLYYSGGNTAHETLAFGTPIVTLPGQAARSRLTLGRYAQMGLAHLAVEDRDEYLTRALLWGKDKDARNKVKAEILTRKNLLFASDESVREYSDFMLSHAF